jgi:hypothetical protein
MSHAILFGSTIACTLLILALAGPIAAAITFGICFVVDFWAVSKMPSDD